jgi:hypothetical protein
MIGIVERCIKRFSLLFIIVIGVSVVTLTILMLSGCTTYHSFEDGNNMDWCNNIGL